MAAWCPLHSLDEPVGLSCYLFFKCYHPQVNVDVVSTQRREWWSHAIIYVDIARARLLLRSIWGPEVVLTLQPLMALHSVLKFKLHLGVNGVEFQRDFVHLLRSKAVVCPSEQELVSFVLELILPSPEELAQLLLHSRGVAPVHCLLDVGFVEIVRQVCQRFRRWCLPNLADEFVPICVLLSWLVQKWTLWFHVKDTVVIVVCSNLK